MTTSEGKGWTKGPWAIDGFNLGAVIVETSPKNWDKIAECGSHDDWRANARLISAAPEGFHAAHLAYAAMLSLPVEDRFRLAHQAVLASLRDYIAKARGASSEDIQNEYEALAGSAVSS